MEFNRHEQTIAQAIADLSREELRQGEYNRRLAQIQRHCPHRATSFGNCMVCGLNQPAAKRAARELRERTPSMYQWTITKDHLPESGEKNDVGKVGPRTATMTAEEIAGNPEGQQFRMLDDDRQLYYEGVIVGDHDGFEPLDDFGTPNAGCTIIQYQENGQWTDL